MLNVEGFLPTILLLLVSFVVLSFYLFLDNRKLRSIIAAIRKEKDNLAEKLAIAEQRLDILQYQVKAMTGILERVFESEKERVRDDERSRIFAIALKEMKAVDKVVAVNVAVVGHDQNKTDISGGEVGQAASGRGNDQKQV
jgi:hypothetical protein